MSQEIIVKRHYSYYPKCEHITSALAELQMFQVLTAQSKSQSILCVEKRPRQTLHSILAHACANITYHVPYCLKECPLLQRRSHFVLLARTERVTESMNK